VSKQKVWGEPEKRNEQTTTAIASSLVLFRTIRADALVVNRRAEREKSTHLLRAGH